MTNLPQSLYLNAPSDGVPTPANPNAVVATAAAAGGRAGANKNRKVVSANQLLLDLSNPESRENALLELSMKRNISRYGSLVVEFFWYYWCIITGDSFDVPCSLFTKPDYCTVKPSLQCSCSSSASHQDTRMPFLNAQIPLYLYTFLKTTSRSRPYEYLRLTSLGVIGALVKVDDSQVISFILSINIITPCLLTMEMGSELSKTLATFIVQKILLDDVGLDYICTTAESLFALGRVLGNMVASLAEPPLLGCSSKSFGAISNCQTMQGLVIHFVAAFQTC